MGLIKTEWMRESGAEMGGSEVARRRKVKLSFVSISFFSASLWRTRPPTRLYPTFHRRGFTRWTSETLGSSKCARPAGKSLLFKVTGPCWCQKWKMIGTTGPQDVWARFPRLEIVAARRGSGLGDNGGRNFNSEAKSLGFLPKEWRKKSFLK